MMFMNHISCIRIIYYYYTLLRPMYFVFSPRCRDVWRDFVFSAHVRGVRCNWSRWFYLEVAAARALSKGPVRPGGGLDGPVLPHESAAANMATVQHRRGAI